MQTATLYLILILQTAAIFYLITRGDEPQPSPLVFSEEISRQKSIDQFLRDFDEYKESIEPDESPCLDAERLQRLNKLR